MRYVRDGVNKDRITQNLRPASEADPCGHPTCTWNVSAAIDLPWREHANASRTLWLSENLCGFRILVVLRGFYGNARNNACEGHAGPHDQQCHQDDHAICEL